jgi:hypothetical protein
MTASCCWVWDQRHPQPSEELKPASRLMAKRGDALSWSTPGSPNILAVCSTGKPPVPLTPPSECQKRQPIEVWTCCCHAPNVIWTKNMETVQSRTKSEEPYNPQDTRNSTTINPRIILQLCTQYANYAPMLKEIPIMEYA